MVKFNANSAVFFGLLALSLLAGGLSLFESLALAIRDDAYTHILLILPVSVGFILLECPWQQTVHSWSPGLGLVLLTTSIAIAVSVFFCGYSWPSDVVLSISMIALVLSWIGAFALCFGSAAFRSALFPLLFLFALVPVPAKLLNIIVASLQSGSSYSAHLMFAMCGVAVVQNGDFLTIPGLTIQVAQECSSIRSSSMLLVTTVVLVQLLLRSPWKKVLVISLAIPLSIAKNGLRIFTIAMLGTRVDPGYLTGKLHHQGGILFFLIGLLAIFFVLTVCQKMESSPTKACLTAKLPDQNA